MSKNKMLAFYFSNARRLYNREAIVPASTVREKEKFTFLFPYAPWDAKAKQSERQTCDAGMSAKQTIQHSVTRK